MTRYLVAAATLLAVTGCVMQTTYPQLMAKPPVQSFATAKSVDEYIGCVSPRLTAIWPNVNTIQEGNAKVLSVSTSQVLVTVRVAMVVPGSQVEVRQIYADRGYERAAEAALACK